MTATYNPNSYAELLASYLPATIRTEEENDRAVEMAGRLLRKGAGRSPEEDRLLDLLATLIEDFELNAYPINATSPAIALREIMREHRLKQSDLVEIFGSQGTVSLVLSGRREISKSQARKLAERFKLPLDVFI
jgi:HTH-type transcriptional regulator / antitoxin HigA